MTNQTARKTFLNGKKNFVINRFHTHVISTINFFQDVSEDVDHNNNRRYEC